MTDRELVEQLRVLEKSNPVASAVFSVFGTRQRTRADLNIGGLMQRMVKSGFNYSREEYAEVLKALGRLGIGTIHANSKGRIVALKAIKKDLKALGKAACGQNEPLMSFKQRNQFVKLNLSPVANQVQKPKQIVDAEQTTLKLVLSINNKDVQMELPRGLTPSEIANLIANIRGKQVG